MEFVKNLSNSEAKYKYIGLTKSAREEFPEKDKVFKMNFQGRSYSMKVNNKNSIMLTQLYEVYEFQPDDQVKIKKIKSEEFELSVN